MSCFNNFSHTHTLPHPFGVGDVIAHVNSPNDVFFVDSVSGNGYKCFWFVDGEPDCERGIGFLFEDEPFLRKTLIN